MRSSRALLAQHVANVEDELRAEQASSLGLAGVKLQKALEVLAQAEHGDAYEEALAHAAERLWFLVIQREAMGFTDHRALMKTYAVPHAVRVRMGPR